MYNHLKIVIILWETLRLATIVATFWKEHQWKALDLELNADISIKKVNFRGVFKYQLQSETYLPKKLFYLIQ